MSRIKSKKYNGVYLNHLKNGDVSYSIVYKDEQNKLIRFTVGKKSEGITEIYAYNKRVEFINKIRLGEDPTAHKKRKKSLSIDNLAKVYFNSKRCMKCNNCKEFSKDSNISQSFNLVCSDRKVKHQYNKYIKHLQKKLGNKSIYSLNKDDILKLKQDILAQDKAESTINGIIQLLNTIINFSIKNRDLNITNPCIGVSKLKTDSNRERYLTLKEINELIKFATDKRARLFIKLSLSTGGRLQTILNIRKKDINLLQGTITLKDIKNNDTYTGFINESLKKELKDVLPKLNSNDYIIGAKSTPLSVNAISVSIRPILNKLFNQGLDKDDRKNRVVIHTLRHTFASHLAIIGTPIFTIQKLMNHKDIKMTMRYAKLAPNSGKDMVNKLYTS